MPERSEAGAAMSTSLSPQETENVSRIMRDLLPFTSEMFSERFFKECLFGIVALYEVDERFGCSHINSDYL